MPEVPSLFEGHNIRKVWFEDEWWFAVVDVIHALTESTNPQVYWRRLKMRLREEGADIVESLHALKVLSAADGKYYAIDCAYLYDIIHIIRLISSISRRERKNMPDEAGVYAIENTLTGECYIGSSFNIPQRWLQHRAHLQKGDHTSSSFQEAWNHDGSDTFKWSVLEYVPNVTELESVEQRYIDSHRPVYNSHSEVTNILSLGPIDSKKTQRFVAYLLESTYLVDNPLIKQLIIGVRYGLISPGPTFHLLSQVTTRAIKTWEDLEVFLIQQSEVA